MQGAQCSLGGGGVTGGVAELAVEFDGHRIFSLEELSGRFPHTSEELSAQRRSFGEQLEKEENATVYVYLVGERVGIACRSATHVVNNNLALCCEY